MSISVRALPQRVTLKLRANVPDSINIESPSPPARGMRIQNFTTTDVYWDTSSTVSIPTAKGIIRPNTAAGEFRTIDISAGTWVVTFLSATAGDLEIDLAAEPFAPESVGQALKDFEDASTALLEGIKATQVRDIRSVRQPSSGSIAAGTQHATMTVPAGERWRLLALFHSLSTNASAGNRLPVIWVADAVGNPAYRIPNISSGPSAASSNYSWLASSYMAAHVDFGGSGGGAVYQAVGMGEAVLLSDWTVRMIVVGLQATDAISFLYWTYEVIPEL